MQTRCGKQSIEGKKLNIRPQDMLNEAKIPQTKPDLLTLKPWILSEDLIT